ncbi:hypothetical protein ACFWA4_05930 [Streptomyces sp. NPDC060011]|uniref:hypothetical protein n=1 Tax=Streptomyces sp. NPDC060011 TaxID=3347037 RepID=UPI0036A02184
MGWEQLLSILDENTDYARSERETPPTACPHDGEPLEEGGQGVLACRFDGYQWPRDGRL